jgi:hypothetical protein
VANDAVPEADPADLQEQADPVDPASDVIDRESLTDDIEVDEGDRLEGALPVPASREDELRETT